MKSERIPVKSFSADNGFIGKMQKLVREEVLPYQYNILNDAIPGIEKSHAIENIRLAAEKLRGKDVKPDEFYRYGVPRQRCRKVDRSGSLCACSG